VLFPIPGSPKRPSTGTSLRSSSATVKTEANRDRGFSGSKRNPSSDKSGFVPRGSQNRRHRKAAASTETPEFWPGSIFPPPAFSAYQARTPSAPRPSRHMLQNITRSKCSGRVAAGFRIGWEQTPNTRRCCSNMEQFIGCDAHKKFSVFVAVNEKGRARRGASRGSRSGPLPRVVWRRCRRTRRSRWKQTAATAAWSMKWSRSAIVRGSVIRPRPSDRWG